MDICDARVTKIFEKPYQWKDKWLVDVECVSWGTTIKTTISYNKKELAYGLKCGDVIFI